MAKYVCLRDDDNCYFTKPSDFINGYGEFWGKVPITLATVPFSHGSQWKIIEFAENVKERNNMVRNWEIAATAEELTAYHRTYPIGENTELVNFLKPLVKSGMVEIAQHGVFHRYNERGPEMFSNEMAFEAVRDGKEYLEKVFETQITTFIPPSNTIDVTCVSYLKRLGMNLFSSGVISKDNTMIPAYDTRFRIHSLMNRLRGRSSEPARWEWGVFKFGSKTYNSFNSLEEIYGYLKKQLDRTGFAALGTHYMVFARKDYPELYQNLLRKLRDEDHAEFVSAKDYVKLIKEHYYE